MSTLTQGDDKLTRTLSFRVTEDFWERVGVMARQQKSSIQALCTAAVEKELDRIEADRQQQSSSAA
jgi:hypothetical protein